MTSAQAFEGNGTLRALENLAYGYDAAGNLASRTNNTLIQTFVSGNRNELTSITRSGTLTVAGSLDGQVTSLYVGTNQAQIYSDSSFATAEGIPLRDGYNQFVTAGTNAGVLVVSTITTNWLPVTSAFSYDLNGNLLSDSHRTFEYDRANQLKSVTLPGTWKTEYAYDGLGRRRITREYTWGNGWALANEIRYVYDRMLVLQERRSDNITLATYTRGMDLSGSMQGAGGIGGLLARSDSTSSAHYHSDGNGNISTLTDSSGTVVARYLYDPFGRVLGKWGPMADVNRYQFSSKETDNLTGLSYYGYRFYDPNLQRWLNEDPIGEEGGINLYGFVGNDPVGQVDPYGLLFKDFFREIGQGLYDTGMKGGGGGDPNSLGKLWGEMEGVDKDNNVLRDAFGEACGMMGDQGTDAAAGKVAAGGLGYVACKLGKPVKALLGKCGELLKRTDDACACSPAAEGTAMRNVVQFQGMEVRAVRDLAHVEQGTLEAMQQSGFAATTVNGDRIVLHHLGQNPAGPLVEMPRPLHSIGNSVQHSFGNTAGAGLTEAQRAAHDAWRVQYWQWRATQEMNARRALGN